MKDTPEGRETEGRETWGKGAGRVHIGKEKPNLAPDLEALSTGRGQPEQIMPGVPENTVNRTPLRLFKGSRISTGTEYQTSRPGAEAGGNSMPGEKRATHRITEL